MLTTPMAIVYQTTTQLFRLEQKALWSSPSGGLHQETHCGWEGTSSWHPTGNPFKVPTHESIFCRSCQQAWPLSNFSMYLLNFFQSSASQKFHQKGLQTSVPITKYFSKIVVLRVKANLHVSWRCHKMYQKWLSVSNRKLKIFCWAFPDEHLLQFLESNLSKSRTFLSWYEPEMQNWPDQSDVFLWRLDTDMQPPFEIPATDKKLFLFHIMVTSWRI